MAYNEELESSSHSTDVLLSLNGVSFGIEFVGLGCELIDHLVRFGHLGLEGRVLCRQTAPKAD